MPDINFRCPSCDTELKVDAENAGATAECPSCNAELIIPAPQPTPPPTEQGKRKIRAPKKPPASPPSAPPASQSMNGHYSHYKVISISEGLLGTLFFGASAIPVKEMEIQLNKEVSNGWQVVFQVVEQKRVLLFWKRETIIITLGK